MAVSSVSSLVASGIGASAAQADSAQKNPLATRQRGDASSITELSAFGKTRLALDDIKASAQAIQNLGNPPTLSDVKEAVQDFVQSLNALAGTVKQSAADASARADTRPAQALNEIRKAVSGPEEGSLAALQKLGISENAGTFSLNQRQLEKTVQENRQDSLSELIDVAERVEEAADKQLAGVPIAEKNDAYVPPEDAAEDARNEEQTRIAQRESFRELLAAQLANAGGYSARNAVTTYFSVAAL